MRSYNLQRYIGLPFEIGGRTFDGVDCWGLVRLFYQHDLGIELPSYSDYEDLNQHTKVELSNLITNEKETRWQDVATDVHYLEFGDVLVFRVKGLPVHVGVYLSENKFLHSLVGINSCTEKLNNHKGRCWDNKLVGACRYE